MSVFVCSRSETRWSVCKNSFCSSNQKLSQELWWEEVVDLKDESKRTWSGFDVSHPLDLYASVPWTHRGMNRKDECSRCPVFMHRGYGALQRLPWLPWLASIMSTVTSQLVKVGGAATTRSLKVSDTWLRPGGGAKPSPCCSAEEDAG